MGANYSKGPLLEFAGQMIAQIPCPADGCAKLVLIKVNKAGWPYHICPRCAENRAQSIGAARTIFNMSGIRWIKGMKGPVLAAMSAPEPEPDAPEVEPDLEFEDEEVTVAVKSKPKRGIRTYFDDDDE